MKHPYLLTGKHILVTGASSGIGQSTCIAISRMGGRLMLTGRNAERLQETMGQLAGEGHAIKQADLTIESERLALQEECEGLDGIVHCAGAVRPFPVKFIGEKQMNEMYGTNYQAPVLLTGGLFKKKKINNGASLVFISSISSQFPYKGGALYAGSKAALNTYCKVIALEYAPQGIRANYINAAMVKTPLFDNAEKAISKELMDSHGMKYPLGFGEPEDIANAVVFLLSPASGWITGTGLTMDGGLSAGQ